MAQVRPADRQGASMKSLDVFSCLGCHAIGLERAGIETSAFCEINPFRREVLASSFPGRTIYEDIRKSDIFASPKSEIIIGGPPCQKTSKAAAIHGRISSQLYRWMLGLPSNVGLGVAK